MGTTASRTVSDDGSRPAAGTVVALTVLYSIELIGILWAAMVVASLGRPHLGRGAGLLAVALLVAAALAGRDAMRLLRGQHRLGVTGLAVQSALVIGAIALATQRPAVGAAGIVVAAGVLVGWGRLARPARSAEPPAVSPEAPRRSSDPSVTKPGAGGALLVLLTAALVLAALSVRGGIVVGMVALAIIFIPLERLFALRPRRILRTGWRTDVVHYLINGAALKVGIVIAVAVVGTVLRAFVPAPCRAAIAASPGAAQVVAALAIATVGGYAGHRAAHEVPLLWRFHRVHHSIRELDWLAANHLHPLDQIFIRSAAVLPLYALDFGRISLGAFVIVTTLQAIFVHANVRLTFGPLRWVIATPQFHHWHHAREPRAYNSNYAGEFPALDALFGTLYLPAQRWPAHYGIDDREPDGYLRQLVWPLTH
ncbi:sterol desaturase family protein [Mycobacterium sp. 852002-51057_SCH5723018]|uniref:sterol desaturase family protein n=1 Tax=Mycobacterium sp. 852002-51057_SCH5723018 TaxID=1834094 RepID=UPI0009EEBD96|nr:sterol desaturase family protein [Mycobacterium sp. 852002-51057_SCH5723018]